MAFVANEYEDGPENIPIFQPEVWLSLKGINFFQCFIIEW